MKVFDFDNTLYRGESAIDFALFMINKNKQIILWIPSIFFNLAKYKLCLIKKDEMIKKLERFMKRCLPDEDELNKLVKQFWKVHKRKLDKRIISRIEPCDAIFSTGPDFLLEPIKGQLGTDNLITSKVDLSDKSVKYLNFRSNKVKRFRKIYTNVAVDEFYTDSFNDRAMMNISKKAYLVKKGKVRRIK